MTLDELADVSLAIARVLSRSLGGDVRVDCIERITESGRSNELLRCRLAAAPAGAPATVMVKRRRDLLPDAHGDSGTRSFYGNWAGLEFLTEIQDQADDVGGAGGAPRFYGGDRAYGIVVMEDLGTPHSLADVLLHGTAAAAERGLLLLASTLGRMHAATAGREAQYAGIRDALGPGDGPRYRATEADEVRAAARTLAAQCAALEVTPPAGFEADVEYIARAVADPGPFLAYTHGDPCPDNNTIVQSADGPAGSVLRLFDFDVGAFRHALRDGVYGRIRFPTCWCVRDIPESIVARMEAIYRAELAKGCPAAADDAVYARASVTACAGWVITTLGWSLERVLERDRVWGESTHRQRILLRLPLFVRLARRAGHLEALADTAARLHRALRQRWEPSTAQITLYPAFAGAGE
jgi:hypothetical protein